MIFVGLLVMFGELGASASSSPVVLSQIERFFSVFKSISKLSVCGVLDHYFTTADVKSKQHLLITYTVIQEWVITKLSLSTCIFEDKPN